MRTNERFLEALWYMDCTMRADNAIGNQWTYCNNKSKKVHGFENKRKAGKFLTNCVDGVQDGLMLAGVPDIALMWYGANGKIAWLTSNARAEAEKYFEIIATGGKKIITLYNNRELCDGDIFVGFQGMAHTCCYTGDLGEPMSFDSGHAYTQGNGEGAKFKKWVGALSNRNRKVNYILRLKDRAHYRVQAGAFSDISKYNEMTDLMRKKGFSSAMVIEDGMYKIQAGSFSGKSNANRLVADLKKAGIPSFVKEI